MEWIGQQLSNVKNTVLPPVDPTGPMQMGQPQEKKPWWKVWGGKKKPKKTKKTKKPKKQTKYKRN